jgi:transposase
MREARSVSQECVVCGLRLVPMSYTLPLEENPSDVGNRPDLKCPGCGRSYDRDVQLPDPGTADE